MAIRLVWPTFCSYLYIFLYLYFDGIIPLATMPNPETTWRFRYSNEKAWEAIIADCKNAKDSIVMEQLIFVTDDFGQRCSIDVCAERAASGVKIRFLWDAWGSFCFRLEYHRRPPKEIFLARLLETIIPAFYKTPNFRSWSSAIIAAPWSSTKKSDTRAVCASKTG